MEAKKTFLLILSSLILLSLSSEALSITNATTSDAVHDLLSCLSHGKVLNVTTLSTSRPSSYYYNLLNSSIRNLRYTGPTVSKPTAIVLPTTRDQLRYSVRCCRAASFAIRLRSGGHSYEGLSYTDDQGQRFVVVDLMNLDKVRVNLTTSAAWVESGATLGEIYHSVATESGGVLGFPAGSCSTVGTGGHIGGGGFGFLGRKFGLAADNVLDAVLVDSNGQALDRASMGEDVFWAIRGGGGGSWGAVYAWKIRLVPVPNRLTVFSVSRLGPGPLIAQLVHKWQFVGPKLPGEFYLSTTISGTKNGTIEASFSGQYLGPSSSVISTITRRFTELGLTESDCQEMSWIDSVVHFAGLASVGDLRSRRSSKSFYKAKSDYVRVPISMLGLVGAFEFLAEEPEAYIILDPYGGAMARFKSGEIPFPHREGNLYSIQYVVDWTGEEDARRERYMAFLRRFYEYMAPFVSMNPRAAYVNYLDLDLGVFRNPNGSSWTRDLVSEARVWGEKYFLKNYDRLVFAKTVIDPDNVLSNSQSIPPLPRK